MSCTVRHTSVKRRVLVVAHVVASVQQFLEDYVGKAAPNKAVKPFACGSLGRSALRTCSGMASPFLPDQSLRAERRLPGR